MPNEWSEPGSESEPSPSSRARASVLAAGALLFSTLAGAQATDPIGVPKLLSPVGDRDAIASTESCPTFSWSLVPDAPGYELVVLRADASALASAESGDVAIRRRLPAGATSWTPDRRSCLTGDGQYAWSVRALTGRAQTGTDPVQPVWAAPARFQVSPAPSVEEVEAALATLRRWNERRGRAEPVEASTSHDLTAARVDSTRGDPTRVGSRDTTETRWNADTRADATQVRPSTSRSLEVRAAFPVTVPTLGDASLTLSGQLHLADASAVFKDDELFLWDEVDAGNLALGSGALASVDDTATGNTAMGRQALANAEGSSTPQHGSDNAAFGDRALYSNTIGLGNTAVGRAALYSNTAGYWSTAIGYYALELSTGAENTAVGASAMRRTTTGLGNTALGRSALAFNREGSSNTALGSRAMYAAGGGSRNVAIGSRAGYHHDDGSDNIFILNEGEGTDDATIKIGTQGTQTSTFVAGIASSTVGDDAANVFVDGNGRLGTKTCGTLLASLSCPSGGDGPKCDEIGIGGLCEGDGECGTDDGLNNCPGNYDFYYRIE